jgi:hypothetical protein
MRSGDARILLVNIALAATTGASVSAGQTEGSQTRADADVVRAGNTVTVDTRIAGDVAVAGGTVEVSGPVEGYVLAAGRDVAIENRVGNDLWAAGRSVSLTGDVIDNAWLAGQSITVQPDARIGDDAYLAGRSVEVLGPIGHDLKVTAADVRLGSEIAGSVDARAGRVHVLPGAVIHGDLHVSGPNSPSLEPGARVLGQVTHENEDAGNRALQWVTASLWMFLAVFLLGAVAIALNRVPIRRAAERLGRQLGVSFLVGLVGMVVVPILSLAIAVTIVGVPLAIAVVALFAAALMLTGVVVSYRVGAMLLGRARGESSPYVQLASGALVISSLAALPWVGWVVGLLVVLSGFGAILLALNDWRRHERAAAPA